MNDITLVSKINSKLYVHATISPSYNKKNSTDSKINDLYIFLTTTSDPSSYNYYKSFPIYVYNIYGGRISNEINDMECMRIVNSFLRDKIYVTPVFDGKRNFVYHFVIKFCDKG